MRRPLSSALLLAAALHPALAQPRTTVTAPRTMAYSVDNSDPNRAMLGVTTTSDGKRDTLGVLVTAVTEGSPAEKAGIEEGNRIASINGVSLKLSPADAGEDDMSGVMSNRLVREMRKLHAGDEATLEVWAGGRYKTVKAKTVAAESLAPMRRTRASDEDRAALGLFVGTTGHKRDTLGVFVSGVSEDGPADKAGIAEGDRIASINGVDLRTPKEDLGDGWMSSTRSQRLQREIAKLKVGQTAELAVISSGRSRSVKVTAGRASDLKGGNGFSYHFGDVPDGAMLNSQIRGALRGIGPQIRMELDRELPRAMDEVRRSFQRIRVEPSLLRTRLVRRNVTI